MASPRKSRAKKKDRPLATLSKIEHHIKMLTQTDRVVDMGPCDPVTWIHRWSDWSYADVRGYERSQRECLDCGVVEGTIADRRDQEVERQPL
jgi:hypothetical protein